MCTRGACFGVKTLIAFAVQTCSPGAVFMCLLCMVSWYTFQTGLADLTAPLPCSDQGSSGEVITVDQTNTHPAAPSKPHITLKLSAALFGPADNVDPHAHTHTRTRTRTRTHTHTHTHTHIYLQQTCTHASRQFPLCKLCHIEFYIYSPLNKQQCIISLYPAHTHTYIHTVTNTHALHP